METRSLYRQRLRSYKSMDDGCAAPPPSSDAATAAMVVRMSRDGVKQEDAAEPECGTANFRRSLRRAHSARTIRRARSPSAVNFEDVTDAPLPPSADHDDGNGGEYAGEEGAQSQKAADDAAKSAAGFAYVLNVVSKTSQVLIVLLVAVLAVGVALYAISALCSNILYGLESYRLAEQQRDVGVDFSRLGHCADPALRTKYLESGYHDCIKAETDARINPLSRALEETWKNTHFYQIQSKMGRLISVFVQYFEWLCLLVGAALLSTAYQLSGLYVYERARGKV
jgi:hypothetical protein